MQRLLSSYEPGDELEVRYYIDPRAPHASECIPAKHPAGFRGTLDKIVTRLGGVDAARHTRIIDLHLGTLRKRIVLADGDRREEWCNKQRRGDWTEPNDFGGFRISIAREAPAAPQKLTHVDRIAIKYRLTYALDCLGQPHAADDAGDAPWLLEISAVKLCDLSTVQDAKTKLLTCRDPFELWGWWDHWEFERELGAGSSSGAMSPENTLQLLETDDLYQTYTLLAPGVNHEMLDTVRRTAVMIEHPKAQSFQRLSPRNTITRLLPKAVEPTLECWIEKYSSRVHGMIVRDKIDGVRELVVLRKGCLICVGAKTVDEWEEDAADDTYVFDCEFLNDVWYVLHPLVWRGRAVTHLRDSERLELLVDLPKVSGLAVCPYRIVSAVERDIDVFWNRRTSYRRDGLILSEDDAYFDQANLKWKPADESTFDMLIVRCPEWLAGKAPYVRDCEDDEIYILNVGSNTATAVRHQGFPLKRYLDIFYMDKSATYVPQPFSPPDLLSAHVWCSKNRDLHGVIGEFIYIHDGVSLGGHWELRRVREDKPSLLRGGTEIGNDVRTAMDIWSKIANPFPLKYLWKPPTKRSSRYDSLAAPVQQVVAELLDEERAASAIVHMCPFVPFSGDSQHATFVPTRGALLPVRAVRPEYIPDLSNNSRVVQVIYEQIGRIDLPKEFIGGTQLLVTMDPELLGHVSCLGKVVAPGGRVVVICRPGAGEDEHPEVGRAALMKDMDRSGFALLTDHGAPDTGVWDVSDDWEKFAILSFRKVNRGMGEMRPDEVRLENPHLSDNPEANFTHKFSRQKTKDIAGLIGRDEPCSSLVENARLGELLVDCEFLSSVEPTAQVFYRGDNVEALRRLFPQMQFLTTAVATAENVEAVVSHGSYEESLELIEQYEPHCGLLDFDHTILERGQVLKGKMMLHPFADQSSTRVSLAYGRERHRWNILSEIFRQEMQTFHRVYRPTAFKYAVQHKEAVHGIHLDNCYDCRTVVYIMTKYAKSQKITVDEAFARLG